MTQATPVLDIANVRRACALLLDRAEQRFGARIEMTTVPVDYYWTVDLAAAFDVSATADPEVNCGQASDDVAEINQLVQDGFEVIALWHDLDHLAGVMRLLAFLDLPGR